MIRRLSLILPALLLTSAALAQAADDGTPAYTDAKAAGPDFAAQGEYVGELKTNEGPKKFGLQVIALGKGKFRAVVYSGGLPGDGWEKGQKKRTHDGETKDGVVVITGDDGHLGKIKDGALTVTDSGGNKLGEFKKIERKSSTLGAKPPEGAVVLFDGKNADAFEGGKMTPDGLLQVGTKSKQSFGSFHMHLEFRTPFMPTAGGQGRGNSGVFLHDCYEFQVLDSFGLEGENNECGGIYSIKAPRVNMCFPPLSWQTYDFDFTAPKFDAAGKKTANARVTLLHNGVAIFQDFELPNLTAGGRNHEAPTGPLQLQNHGNPVNFRNIWVVERK
ncbi:MAG TPA: DUF1080 domain-containing protein [Pirellulales bacterium]|nr:DUF1080 domain-containing protein [Pirellulales bacterium]